jgi:opacity protein-like surface antigen
MKKMISLAVLFLALIVPQYIKAFELPCFDLCGLYVSTTGAANFVHVEKAHRATISVDDGYLFTGAVGYRFCNDFRVEGEFGYRSNDLRHVKFDLAGQHFTVKLKGHVHTYSGLANLYYDIPVCFYVRPYVGAGIGYACATHRVKVKHFSHAATNRSHCDGFAWQVIAGFAYPVCDNVDVSLEYRFFRAERTNRAQNHDVGVNLKYFF